MALPLLDRPGDFIAGEFANPGDPDEELVIQSPADLSDRTAVHPYAVSQVARAVDAARQAQPAWRRTSEDDRRALLLRYRDRLCANREAIALTIAREAG